MGSTPVGRKFFLPKTCFFVVAHLLEYLGATAPLRTVYFANSRLEKARFILKILRLNRENRPERNFRQKIYCRELPSGVNFFFLKLNAPSGEGAFVISQVVCL